MPQFFKQEAIRRWACAARAKVEPEFAQACQDAKRAFTEHPESAGETYLQHLGFTAYMSARFLFTSFVIMVHGLFPFLMERTASSQIEAMYRIMKSRIPPARRNEIDTDYTI